MLEQLNLFAEDHLARPLASLDCAKVLTIQEGTLRSNTCGQSMPSSPSGLCGKMSLEHSPPQEIHLDALWRDWLDMIPQSSPLVENGQAVGFSLQKMKTPIPWPGASWMPNTLECPNDAVESSLSDVLEEDRGGNLSKYYLSDTAKSGILRRAEKRGKKLPEMLEAALRQ